MTMILSLYDGVHTELDLIDAAGTDYYAHADGALTFPANEVVQVAVGEDGNTQIYSRFDGVREFVVLISLGGTRDEALNNAQAIHRWLQQAARATENENSAHPVYLKVQEEGASNATIHRIIHGMLDEGKSHLNWRQIQDDAKYKIYKARLHLQVWPTGTTTAPIKANNIMVGAPAMERWESGIPHGWNKINGAETFARLNDKAYIGPYVLQVVTGTTNHGLLSDYTELVTPYNLVRAMVHLNVVSGTWTVRLESASGAVADVSGITNANQAGSGTVESRNGATWYIYDVAQTTVNLTTDTQFRLRIFCTTSSGSLLVDSALIKDVKPINVTANPGMDTVTDDGVVPDGWEVSADANVVAGVDNTNYATAPGAATVTISQLASDNTTYFRQVLAEQFVQGHEHFGHALVRVISHGGQTVKFALWDGADNEIDSIEFDFAGLPGEAEASLVGLDAADYYKLKLQGTNTNAPGARLIFYPTSTGTADINLIIDECYLLTAEGPVFSQVYVSKTGLLYPRNDYESADAANEDHVDNFRLANVPGNRPALVNLNMTLVTAAATDRTFYISRFTEEKHRAIEHQIEAEDFTTGSGTWAGNAGADWTMETANQFTSAGSEGYIEHAFPPAPGQFNDWFLPSLGSVERLVFARAQTDSAAPTAAYLRFVLTHHFDELLLENERAYFLAASTKQLLYLGRLNLNFSEAGWNFNRVQARARVYAFAENTKKVWVDNVLFLSAEDGGWMSFHVPELDSGEIIVIDSVRGVVVRASESVPMQKHMGTKRLTVLPGNISSQFIIGYFEGSTLVHDIDETIELTVEIWPQTTTLLGTK